MPARPGPGKFALKKIHCQRRCLLLTRAAQGLGGAPQCEWHLTGGKQPIPGLTRWNIVPKLLGLHRLLQFFEEDRVLEDVDVVLSGRDMAAALLPKPESKQPCLQRHRCLACSKASDSCALVGAPSQTRLLELKVISPMQAIAWVTGDRYNGAKGRRLRACAATKVEDLI